ncbi:hypothetical protein EDB87DRAFT_1685904 [Lactarius vividus]|nr:hypothetical protein EDB87DRAFT_1685904 [Lactarius vividus]
MLIHEHVFKAPGAVLQTTFRSILHLNRTDLETLLFISQAPRPSPDSTWKRSPDAF